MQERPVYLDLTKIKLPMSAFSSITHRLSGMYVFFVSVPVFLYCIYLASSNKSNFDTLILSLSKFSFFSFLVYVSILVLWYHTLTGIRHLIMDFFHIGESLKGSNYSAIFVIVFWIISSLGFLLLIILWEDLWFGIYKDIAL